MDEAEIEVFEDPVSVWADGQLVAWARFLVLELDCENVVPANWIMDSLIVMPSALTRETSLPRPSSGFPSQMHAVATASRS